MVISELDIIVQFVNTQNCFFCGYIFISATVKVYGFVNENVSIRFNISLEAKLMFNKSSKFKVQNQEKKVIN